MNSPRKKNEMVSIVTRASGLTLLTCLAVTSLVPTTVIAAEPTRTTATYDDWISRCRTGVNKEQKAITICEMVHAISLKKKNQVIAQVAIGRLPNAKNTKIVFQLPLRVSLRDGITFNLNGKTTFKASYVACQPNSCLADADLTDKLVAAIKVAKTATISFTDAAKRRNTLPISLKGFKGAHRATFGG